jgi:MYXO-CTERM domain-containing protein
MRMTMSFTIAAVALLAANPASAQNETAQSNATDVNATVDTTTQTSNDVTTVAVANDTTVAPADTTVADNAAPAPEGNKSFPWGVLGLLGLVGLLGRKRS